MYSNTAWTVRDNLRRSVATDWVIFVRPAWLYFEVLLKWYQADAARERFLSPGVPRTSCSLRIRIHIITRCAVSYGPSSCEGQEGGQGRDRDRSHGNWIDACPMGRISGSSVPCSSNRWVVAAAQVQSSKGCPRHWSRWATISKSKRWTLHSKDGMAVWYEEIPRYSISTHS